MKKPGVICKCGTCESAARRAIGIVGKMIADGECPQYTVAVGVALSAVGSKLIHNMVAEISEKEGMPSLLAAIHADMQMPAICDGISDQIGEWFETHSNDIVHPELNVHLTRHNERVKAEKDLPKGT